MKACIVYRLRSGDISPALETDEGHQLTAPFTTCDEGIARRYARQAERLNPHNDPNAIRWPERVEPMDLACPSTPDKGAL